MYQGGCCMMEGRGESDNLRDAGRAPGSVHCALHPTPPEPQSTCMLAGACITAPELALQSLAMLFIALLGLEALKNLK